MDIDITRKLRQQGQEMSDLIFDLIFAKGITQAEIALLTGLSETQISLVFNPNHRAYGGFKVKHLPLLMYRLDGEKIARVICAWLNMLPTPIPTGKIRAGHIMTEIGHLSTVIGDAMEDGDISIKETSAIKKELLDVISSVDELMAHQVEGL